MIVFTGVVALLPVLTAVVPPEPPALEEPEAGVVVAVPGGVFEATCGTDEALPLSSMPCERSIKPIFGSVVAVAVSVSAEAVADGLEPDPPPQAARVSTASETRTTLRIWANCDM